MFTLPNLSRRTLAMTYKAIAINSLGITRTEKWAIGQAGLFLHEAGCLNADALEYAIKSESRNKITQVVYDGLNEWHGLLESNAFFDIDTDLHFPVEVGLYCFNDHSNGLPLVSGDLIAYPYAYDLKPLTLLSDDDAEIVVRSLAEVRSVLLLALLPQDIEEYQGFLLESLEAFGSWLPEEIRNNPNDDAVREYWRQNNEKYPFHEDDAYGDNYEKILSDYLDRRIKMPTWYSLLGAGTGLDRPLSALSRLRREAQSVCDPDAKLFVARVIESLSHFLKYFRTNKEWCHYRDQAQANENDWGYEEGVVFIESAFLLTWGTKGYWWDSTRNFAQMQMEAGEQPIYRAFVDNTETRKIFRKKAEAVYRGAAIYMMLTELADTLAEKYSECVQANDPNNMYIAA